MTERIVFSNFGTGFETDRRPFLINNDAFPVLRNAFLYRGRIKKKLGTSLLGRLRYKLTNQLLQENNTTAMAYVTPGLGSRSIALFTIYGINVNQPNAQLVPGTVANPLVVTLDPGGANETIFTDTLGTGALTITGAGPIANSATINYATGVITANLTASPGSLAVRLTLAYYPDLPVLGCESFDPRINGQVNFERTIFLDKRYSYQFSFADDWFYNTNYHKITGHPLHWNGADYEQFWSCNYYDALWVTNNVPGMHFLNISAITAGTPTIIQTLGNHNLSNGDYVYINETTGAAAAALNGISFDVSNVTANTFEVAANTGAGINNVGIVQTLTSSTATSSVDGIRWMDGDGASGTPPPKGWVNFAPPLSNVTNPEYLVGAKLILPFKDRLIFWGVWTRTSTTSAIFNPNTIVFSWNGTPFYASPVPDNQTANNSAYYANVAGFGGDLTAPITQEIMDIGADQDVILVGFETAQQKLVYTNDDSLPFIFQGVDSDYGTQSTFSAIIQGNSKLSVGDYGIIRTNQTRADRVDLIMPDQVFDIESDDNGNQRVCAVRDFKNNFIYWTYPSIQSPAKFPNKTVLYNYFDNNFAIWDENFTHYGTYRPSSDITWGTLNRYYPTWAEWTDAWNSAQTQSRYPNIVGGNQQGFVLIKDDSTDEDNTNYIKAVSGDTITSPDHCMNDLDYIQVSNALGVSNLNDTIFQIKYVDRDTFTLLRTAEQPAVTGTYLGEGIFKRFTNVDIRSKQFPIAWPQARKTRFGVCHILADKTTEGQFTFDIYTNLTDNFASSDPDNNPYLPFTNVVLTSPEPNDINVIQPSQSQIWHRSSNSFVGDTLQFRVSLSDAQMRQDGVNNVALVIHAFVFDIYPGPMLY